MGDFNPNSPNPLGLERRYQRASVFQADSPLKAIALRFRPGAVTISDVHAFLSLVQGTPGLALEIVDDLEPTVVRTKFFPGTDTNKITTGWTDQAGGAANFGEVDAEYTLTDYHRNSGIVARNAWIYDLFSGNDGGALSGARIITARLGAQIRPGGFPFQDRATPLQGVLRLNAGADEYLGRRGSIDQFKVRWTKVYEWQLGEFPLNPATGLPWEDTEIDDLLDSTDASVFGVRVGGLLGTQQFRIGAMWLDVEHVATDNRYGSLYASDSPEPYWVQRTLNDTAALSANTWYYLVAWALNGSQSNFFQVPILEGSDATEAATAAGTGEHRRVIDVVLRQRSGVGRSSSVRAGSALPVLLDASATINSQSVPYTGVHRGARVTVPPTGTEGGAFGGQQFTTPGAGLPAAYGAFIGPIGWGDLRLRPDAPLVVELRTTGTIGGGALLATATVDPGDFETGELTEQQIPFDTAVALATSTQYHLYFTSAASASRPWQTLRYPTNNDSAYLSGTTAAEVGDASFGGTVDNYELASGAMSPAGVYDAPYALLAAPDAPADVTLTVEAAVQSADPNAGMRQDVILPSIFPPRTVLEWTATGLGADFGGYRVYRRLRSQPAVPWGLIGDLSVPDGYDAATVEDQHTSFVDYEAGWDVDGSAWADGWEYAVTAIEDSTGLESVRAVTSTPATAEPDPSADTWLTANAAPWLHAPLRTEESRSTSPADEVLIQRAIGRDHASALVPSGIPAVAYALRWTRLGHVSEETTRQAWAAALGGRAMTLLDCRGDKATGVVSPPKISRNDEPTLEAEATLTVTRSTPAVAGYNRPSGLVLDGAADYVAHLHDADLNPAGEFTIFELAAFEDAASVTHLSKINAGITDGYGFWRDAAGSLQFIVVGASATATATEVSAAWYDGTPRVAVGVSTGAAQVLYRDGVSVGTGSTTHGAVANTDAFIAGAGSNGGAQWSALDPVIAYGYYPRALNAAEVERLTHYLLGYFARAAKAPPGAELFVDLRDSRCWDGIEAEVADLSRNAHNGSIVSSPPTRGVPWPLAQLTRRLA